MSNGRIGARAKARHCVLRFGAVALLLSAGGCAATEHFRPEHIQRMATSPFEDSQGCAGEAKLFGEGAISSGHLETSGTLSEDGRTIYFTRMGPDFGQFFFTILESTFIDGAWREPKVASFSGRYSDTSPFLSPDGQRLIFSSNRPVDGVPKASRADFDLWIVERTSTGWSAPTPLRVLNTPGWEMHSSSTRDGVVYFGRSDGDNYDIWRARMTDGQYQPPERLGSQINTAEVEYDPFVDPDERYLIFGSSGHPDNRGVTDFYISFNRDGVWSEAQSLGAAVNTSGREAGGFVYRQDDRAYFVFNSEWGRRLGQPIRPDRQMSAPELEQILAGPENQLRNFYSIELCGLGISGLQ